MSYYRLKQGDFDGATAYSQILVLREKQNMSITFFEVDNCRSMAEIYKVPNVLMSADS